MNIIKAEILSHPIIKVITDEETYIIDFSKPWMSKDQEYERIINDEEYFYNNFEWDKWNVWWSPTEDISIDELEYGSKGYL